MIIVKGVQMVFFLLCKCCLLIITVEHFNGGDPQGPDAIPGFSHAGMISHGPRLPHLTFWPFSPSIIHSSPAPNLISTTDKSGVRSARHRIQPITPGTAAEKTDGESSSRRARAWYGRTSLTLHQGWLKPHRGWTRVEEPCRQTH